MTKSFRSRYNDFVALPGELSNRWVVPGDEELTDVPVILDKNTANTNASALLAYELYNKSTVRVADGSYVRLRNVRFAYRVPAASVQRIGLSHITLSLEGQNLLLLYSDNKLQGQDPEYFSTGGVSLPQLKTITFSLSVGL